MINYTIINNEDITSSISDGAFRLYCLFTSMAYASKTEVYPSQRYIGEKLHKSVRQVQRYIKELVAAGLIKIKRRGSISNIYTLLHKLSNVINKTIEKAKNSYSAYKSNKKDNTFSNYHQREYTHEQFSEMEKILLE